MNLLILQRIFFALWKRGYIAFIVGLKQIRKRFLADFYFNLNRAARLVIYEY